jgi:hypothetical protein
MTRLSASILLLLGVAACGKKVPAELKPTLDAIRPDARKVADAAATACATQYASGRFTASAKGCAINLLPGETVVPTIPSPAKGTALDANTTVLDVLTTCNAPTTASESCGVSLGSLRNAITGPGAGRQRTVAEGNCKAASTDCEELIVPSQRAADETSTDLRIVKPVSGGPAGATAEVTIILAKK